MERVKERLIVTRTALSAFKEVVGRDDLTTLERDGAIQRFEFTYEAAWKAAQAYLREFEKIEVASPRGIARASFQAGIISDEQAQQLLKMSDDRNVTVHTYNEKFAKLLYAKLDGHAKLMEAWLDTIQSRSE